MGIYMVAVGFRQTTGKTVVGLGVCWCKGSIMMSNLFVVWSLYESYLVHVQFMLSKFIIVVKINYNTKTNISNIILQYKIQNVQIVFSPNSSFYWMVVKKSPYFSLLPFPSSNPLSSCLCVLSFPEPDSLTFRWNLEWKVHYSRISFLNPKFHDILLTTSSPISLCNLPSCKFLSSVVSLISHCHLFGS